MPARFVRVAIVCSFVLASGCGKDGTKPIPKTPTHLNVVSGSGQAGDLGVALAAPLIVQALDGAQRPATNVAITWTVTGGGSVSPASGTTDAEGKVTTTWTLGPGVGTQVATATSTAITGAAAAFVASNGPTILGTVSLAGGGLSNFAASRGEGVSRAAARRSAARTSASTVRRFTPDRVVVGFRSDVMGLATLGSAAYRSSATADAAAGLMRARLATITRGQPVDRVEASPAMLAARMRVRDVAQLDQVMATLRADPAVAWVERDAIVTIRDGAPRPVAVKVADFTPFPVAPQRTAVPSTLPNDPLFFAQMWHYNMMNLPRAWTITTGSPSVLVAVIDQGIRFDHPEVTANLTADGYDFVSQVGFGAPQDLCDGGTFDTIDGDGDGPDPDPTDPDDLLFDGFEGCWFQNQLGDHGLWTSGIVGGVGNNAAGGNGVNWSVKIRPIRVLGITGDGTAFDVAQGILYGAGLPATGPNMTTVRAPTAAPIISISIGSSFPANSERDAAAAAVAAGTLIVASAGNGSTDQPSFPAAYPNVMSVSAVGQDGALASYSNGGTSVSVAAPGGEFRLDDNGGGGVIGPGWDFVNDRPVYLAGYGTSASAPHVAGVAALLLAQTPGLTAAVLRNRIEQFAIRAPGTTRDDTFGWGIVDAFNSLTQTNGPPRRTFARLVDPATGGIVSVAPVSTGGAFAFTRLAVGNYLLQAGEDESADNILGAPGRRFGWAGTFAAPTSIAVAAGQTQAIAITLGLPRETEPNDDQATANVLTLGSYVIAQITTPDVRDTYKVLVPVNGSVTFETSGLVGSCGQGIELDTVISVVSATGTPVGTSDNFTSVTSRFCSRVTATLAPGTYFVTVTGTAAAGFADHGRYRLAVRAGP